MDHAPDFLDALEDPVRTIAVCLIIASALFGIDDIMNTKVDVAIIVGLLLFSIYAVLEYNALSSSYDILQDSWNELDWTRKQAVFTQGLLIPIGLDQHYERIRQYESQKFSSKGDAGWLVFYVSQVLHGLGNFSYVSCRTEFNSTTGVPCRNLTTQFAEDFIKYVNESLSLVGTPSSNVSKIEAVYGWVNDFVSYTNDTGDFPRFPIETLTCRYGDCEDQAMALSYLLESEGYDTALCLLRDTNLTEYGPTGLTHVFCAVRKNGFEYNGTLISLKGYEASGQSWFVLDSAFNHAYGEDPEWMNYYRAQNGTVSIPSTLWNALRVDQDELAIKATELGIQLDG